MPNLTDLNYESHLEIHKHNLRGDPLADAHWHREAEYMHALTVVGAVSEIHVSFVTLSHRVGNSEAKLQLVHGVSRRSAFVCQGLRELIALIHPNRTNPLKYDDADKASSCLNVIYINLSGALDNIAWSLYELFGDEGTRQLPRSKVGLFQKAFRRDPALMNVTQFLKDFMDWGRDLKSRRDPAVHRIPLSIPPAAFDESGLQERDCLFSEYTNAINEIALAGSKGVDEDALLEKKSSLYEQLQSLGKFVPAFVHHPGEGATRIYPTVPGDIGKFVAIAREARMVIRKKLAPGS